MSVNTNPDKLMIRMKQPKRRFISLSTVTVMMVIRSRVAALFKHWLPSVNEELITGESGVNYGLS